LSVGVAEKGDGVVEHEGGFRFKGDCGEIVHPLTTVAESSVVSVPVGVDSSKASCRITVTALVRRVLRTTHHAKV
jgi:hypothetical protein